MNLTPESKVLIQGITEPLSSTHAARMAGTNVIAGVNPGQGWQTLHDIPVFDLVEQALAELVQLTPRLSLYPCQALDAALETIGIRQIIIISAGMPPLDMVLPAKQATETLVVGPNSPVSLCRKDSPRHSRR